MKMISNEIDNVSLIRLAQIFTEDSYSFVEIIEGKYKGAVGVCFDIFEVPFVNVYSDDKEYMVDPSHIRVISIEEYKIKVKEND